MAGGARTHDGLSRISSTAGPGGRQAVASRAMGVGVACRALAVVVGHALRRKIAVVHSLGAIFARSSAVLVNTFGLAFAASYTGTSSPERCRAHDARRHGEKARGMRGGDIR